MAEENKLVVLSVKLIDEETKELVQGVEHTIGFIGGEEQEEPSEAKTLDEVIEDFVASLEELCKAKGFQIINKSDLYFEIAIKLAFSVRIKEEEVKAEVEVPITKVEKSKEPKGGSDDSTED